MYYTVTRQNDEAGDGKQERKTKRRRARANAPKEKVLHTRVPAVLEEELKRLAKNLRVPVSNVVRAILEDAVDAVDTVSEVAEDELMGFVDRISKQRDSLRTRMKPKPTDDDPEPAPAPEAGADPEPAIEDADAAAPCPAGPEALLDGAFAFQPIVLAADAACSVCGIALPAGSEASRALFDDPQKRVFLGPQCRLMPAKG